MLLNVKKHSRFAAHALNFTRPNAVAPIEIWVWLDRRWQKRLWDSWGASNSGCWEDLLWGRNEYKWWGRT